MDWQSLTREACAEKLKTSLKKGLSPEQCRHRLEKYGANEITGPKRRNIAVRFFMQFSDFMVLILLAAAAISFLTSKMQGSADADAAIILAIVVINAVIGVIQETRAEKAIEALQKLSSPQAHVIRSGREETISAAMLVPGDLVRLKAGDLVPADLRLTAAVNLKAEESALTGESLPSDKNANGVYRADTPLGDRHNLMYSASSVTSGHGEGIVVATGMHTQVGRIAGMIGSQSAPETPLRRRLAQTGKILGEAALAICLVIFIMGLLQHVEPLEMFMISISLAVAAIPEGLPAVVTVTLALGVRRMAARRAIVRQLPAVETLGCASVICSDKTGTLTQNRMTVVEIAGTSGKIQTRSAEGRRLLQLAALCTNCEWSGKRIIGDPTETAIVRAAAQFGENEQLHYPRTAEIPFSSERKRMTVVHRAPDGSWLIVSKGAPEFLAPHCRNGVPSYINSEMASRALRVLGVAYRQTSVYPENREEMENGLTFTGFIGMMDPPRPEVKSAVELCKRAGIRPVMITGDHARTAAAVAAQLGIAQEGSAVFTGSDLKGMPDEELKRQIGRYSVFARVSPEHKVRIVRALQANGEVVAMTGDGVNDAPALRAADIGCAMGAAGTEVAKEASDMILTDDNFATIVSAVREGRGIYENIRKTVHFLLSCNVGEILAVFVGFLMRLPAPLAAIQLLWVNLVTDSLPALALGAEPIEDDVMDRPPIGRGESIFSGGMAYSIAVEGCMIGSLSILAYSVGRTFFDVNPESPVIGRTMSFAVLSLSQIVHTFNMRSKHSAFSGGLARNWKLMWAAVICTALQVAVIAVPQLCAVFKTVALTAPQWGSVAALSLIPLFVVETEKALTRHTLKRRKTKKYRGSAGPGRPLSQKRGTL